MTVVTALPGPSGAKTFLKSGHWPTLFASFLHFDHHPDGLAVRVIDEPVRL